MVFKFLIFSLVAVSVSLLSYVLSLHVKCDHLKRWARSKKGRRYRLRFERVFPDSVDMMAQSLRAGMSLPQGIRLVAEDGPEPVATECSWIISQLKKGRGLNDLLTEWRSRIGSEDLSMFVESVLILRETGGNLIETFDLLVKTIRERQRIHEKIRTATMQGVVQSAAIALLPILMVLVLYYMATWYIQPLLTTTIGWCLIAAALFLQILGGLWLKKIVTIRI